MGLDLITLDEYKLIEGIGSSQYDDKFDAIITSVSQLVKTYCGNDFVDYSGSPGYTEYFDIQWDTHVIQLEKSPIIAINSVSERTSQSTAYVQIYSGGAGSPAEYSWYFDNITDSIFRTTESGAYKCWPRGVGAVVVNYTSGYATLPEDLKLAVIDLVTYYHKDQYKERQSIGSSSREGAPTGFSGSFPDHIKRVLDLYRGL